MIPSWLIIPPFHRIIANVMEDNIVTKEENNAEYLPARTDVFSISSESTSKS